MNSAISSSGNHNNKNNKNHYNNDESLTKIINVVLSHMNASCGGRYYFILDAVTEAPSAQQQVFILTFTTTAVVEQQPTTVHHPVRNHRSNDKWEEALQSGHDRLVLRIWKGGAQWWNLHRNTNPSFVARQEIMGYETAYQVFNKSKRQHQQVVVPRIPRVLHFEEVGTNEESTTKDKEVPVDTDTAPITHEQSHHYHQQQHPWAILEYVGPDSEYLPNDLVDTTYMDTMIKVRFEFGFEEPHPRWGRIPNELSLNYALFILHQVMIPLHNATRRNIHNQQYPPSPRFGTNVVYTYSVMVQTYRDALVYMKATTTNVVSSGHKHHDRDQKKLERWLGLLGDALTELERIICQPIEDSHNAGQDVVVSDMISNHNNMLPVLVHMDLQPQNLIFYNKKQSQKRVMMLLQQQSNDILPSSSSCCISNSSCGVFSVLDWEEASYADPRFDVLMLCRKVCANREQADIIWAEYASATTDTFSDNSNETLDDNMDPSQDVMMGSITPWLRLETVHSITTLLLQSMDLLNGSRNPWETQHDLSEKLQREFSRLEKL